MTKKSYARQQRDAQKKLEKELEQLQKESDETMAQIDNYFKENTAWDELEQIFNHLSTQLVTNLRDLIDIYKQPGVVTFLEKDEFAETKILLEGTKRDFDELGGVLKTIHDKHADRTGNVKDDDDFRLSLELFEAYQEYSIRYNTIIGPNFTTLIEKASFAMGKMQEAAKEFQQQQDLADPTVISDIEIKEPIQATESVPETPQETTELQQSAETLSPDTTQEQTK